MVGGVPVGVRPWYGLPAVVPACSLYFRVTLEGPAMEWWTVGVPCEWIMASGGGLTIVFDGTFDDTFDVFDSFEYRLHKAGIGVLMDRPGIPPSFGMGGPIWA